jgi:hypothetical protein
MPEGLHRKVQPFFFESSAFHGARFPSQIDNLSQIAINPILSTPRLILGG